MRAPPALRARLSGILSQDPDLILPDDEFDLIAREIFAFQFEHNAPYAAYCRRRQLDPDNISHWSQIPPVPTAAFKEVPLIAGGASDAAVVFRTSGTTRGAEQRGVHYLVDAKLYEDALVPMFAAYLLPDAAQLAFVSLVTPAAGAPDSSLSYMVTCVTDRLAAIDAGSFMDSERGFLEIDLEHELDEFILNGTPVLLVGTSFAFVHWLDSLAARGQRLLLPEGSRLMDTGGYKGRSRTVARSELRNAYADRLGVPDYACVNEYGMTELCSQFYDVVLRDRMLGRSSSSPSLKRPAPWVRTRVVNPETLEPVSEGDVGILQHFDLANLYSVLAVQTEDLGRLYVDGVETLGRVEGAIPRGCSIALDLMLEALGPRP